MEKPAAQRYKVYLARLKAKNNDDYQKKKRKERKKEKETGYKSWKIKKTVTKYFWKRTD